MSVKGTAGAAQGSRMKRKQNRNKIIIIIRAMTSSSGDRHFIGHIFQDVENHMPDNSKVFGRMVFSDSGMVFPESKGMDSL